MLKLVFDMNGVQIGTRGYISYDDTELYDELVYIFQSFGLRRLLEMVESMTVTDKAFADAIIKLIKE